MFVRPMWRQRKESTVVDHLATRKSQLSQSISLRQQGGDGLVSYVLALMKINLEDIRAVLCKGTDGLVRQLLAVVEFELLKCEHSSSYARAGKRQSRARNIRNKRVGEEKTNPLDVLAAFCEPDHALAIDSSAARDVQSLQSTAAGCNGIDRSLGDLVDQRNVKGQEKRIVLDEGDEAHIRQTPTPRQRQALNAGAHGQWHHTAIIDTVSQSRQVQPPDEVSVREVGLLDSQGLADQRVFVPV